MAILAHVLGIVSQFLGALIIYLMARGKSFARQQACEALNFQITIGIAMLLLMGCWMALIFSTMATQNGLVFILAPVIFGLYLGVWVSNIVFCIIAGIRVSNGAAYRYPIALRLVRP
jgi:uncharacterized Tic20 family protein